MVNMPANSKKIGPATINIPPIRRPIAVLLSRFPLITETFILYEVIELERQGQPVLLVPLLEETPRVAHKEAESWRQRAFYTPLISPGILAANLRTLRRKPIVYLRTLIHTLAGSARNPRLCIGTAVFFAKSVYLSEKLEQMGIHHIHAHFATHPTMSAYIISSLTNSSFSFTAHAHDIFVRRAMLGEKLRKASFIRSISRFNKDFLTRLYPDVSEDKFHVIHAGTDPNVFAPETEKSRFKEKEGHRLLTVAALKYHKGIPVLIESCRRLREKGFRFLCEVVGDGPLRDQLENLIRKYGLADVVRLLGAKRRDEVSQLLKNCYVFILPSIIESNGRMEGIPVSLMEAMASKRPVIASALSGINELVDDGLNGILVEPGNVESLTSAIMELINNPEYAKRLGEKGFEKVKDEFQINDCVNRLLTHMDRFNPPIPDNLINLIRTSSYPVFKNNTIGLRGSSDRQDSLILNLMVAGETSTREIVFKIHKSHAHENSPAVERARREYETLGLIERLFSRPITPETCGSSCPESLRYGVPHTLHLDENIPAVVMDACPGVPLVQYIRQGRFTHDEQKVIALNDAITRSGHWLRIFQDSTKKKDDAHAFLDAMIDQARKDLKAVEKKVIHPWDVQSIEKRIKTLIHKATPLSPVVCGHHGDFWPGNIFVDSDRVTVIDFEGFRQGLDLEDTAYFLVYLELFFYYPTLGKRGNEMVSAFLNIGYGDDQIPDQDLLELCMLAKALRVLARSQEMGKHNSFQRWRRQKVLLNICLGNNRHFTEKIAQSAAQS
jgi:glycosyltransferase involved in cell wall biosynthesis